MQKYCSRKDVRNSEELHRSALTFVGGKKSDGILINTQVVKYGEQSLGGRREHGSLSLLLPPAPGNLDHLVATSIPDTFALGIKGSPVFFSRMHLDSFSSITLSLYPTSAFYGFCSKSIWRLEHLWWTLTSCTQECCSAPTSDAIELEWTFVWNWVLSNSP